MPDREGMDQDVSRWDAVAEEYSKWIEGGQDARGRVFTDVVNEAALKAIGNVRSLRVLDGAVKSEAIFSMARELPKTTEY